VWSQSLLRYDDEVDICCSGQCFVTNRQNGQLRVKSPLKSFRKIDMESVWIVDLRNKHLSWLDDHNRQPPFQSELPSLWIKVHADRYSTDSAGVDPCKCSDDAPINFTCQTRQTSRDGDDDLSQN